jgi:hypothetical protein
MKQLTLTIHGINETGPAYCEALGLSKVFTAYAENCANEEISYSGVGFNPNSGYFYIALKNGISICSMLGTEVKYRRINLDSNEDYFFSTYHEALIFDIYNIENID